MKELSNQSSHKAHRFCLLSISPLLKNARDIFNGRFLGDKDNSSQNWFTFFDFFSFLRMS